MNVSSFSVVVTAHNMAGVVVRTLQSVEASIEFLRGRESAYRCPPFDIVVVDDGSKDATWQTLEAFASRKEYYRLIRHPEATSPSFARNAGVHASRSEVLFFLDGDDLFYPDHIAACLRAMEQPGTAFVKTWVHIADPIHADWVKPINGSVVINLCVRRSCHDLVGGFPDFLLCDRNQNGAALTPVVDIFFKFEDMYYNQMITRLFPGIAVERETVENLRYPGNSFDRQYEKFCLPMGAYAKPQTEPDNFRLTLCDAILAHRLHELRTRFGADERGFLKPGYPT
jgi:glycosyltransferase involved in cell wall biosynthesis